MSKIKNGGPAFPRPASSWNSTDTGMSLRDYFAGQALGNAELMSELWNVGNERTAAHIAYTIADAMLKEREQ